MSEQIRSILSEIDAMSSSPLPVKQEEQMERQEQIAYAYEEIGRIAGEQAALYRGNSNMDGGRRKKTHRRRRHHRRQH